jgi:hypothetical protein
MRTIKPVLLIDSREKIPWQFEGDEDFSLVKYTKLDAGDYSIEGMENIISIERKANVDELFSNFINNKERIHAEFERLKDHKIRIVIVEQNCEDVFNPMKYYVNAHGLNKRSVKMPVAVVMSNLIELMLKFNVHIIFGGSKSRHMAKDILLAAYKMHRQEKL